MSVAAFLVAFHSTVTYYSLEPVFELVAYFRPCTAPLFVPPLLIAHRNRYSLCMNTVWLPSQALVYDTDILCVQYLSNLRITGTQHEYSTVSLEKRNISKGCHFWLARCALCVFPDTSRHCGGCTGNRWSSTCLAVRKGSTCSAKHFRWADPFSVPWYRHVSYYLVLLGWKHQSKSNSVRQNKSSLYSLCKHTLEWEILCGARQGASLTYFPPQESVDTIIKQCFL